MNEPYFIRPHHGLCLKHFVGKGYSPLFVAEMTALCAELGANPSQEIILKSETDRLCNACPHNRNSMCETAQKTSRYDRRCLALCGLHNGEKLKWQEFERLIAEKILQPQRLCEICGDCCWSAICQKQE